MIAPDGPHTPRCVALAVGLSFDGKFAGTRRPAATDSAQSRGRHRLPNGKSQKDAIAKQNHEEALKDAGDLVAAARELQDQLRKAGSYVVPVESVKKTEEIEKLARRIRGRLKGCTGHDNFWRDSPWFAKKDSS